MSNIENFLRKKIITSNEVELDNLKVNGDVLFHGIKIEHAEKALLENKYLEARTTQRYWKDGRYLQDNHPDYEESGWMYGWSMSRDKYLASSFGNVLFIFDKKKIQEQFKVVQLSWSYRVANGSQYTKKEREEFILSHKNPNPIKRELYWEYVDSLLDDEKSPYEDLFEFHRLHNTKPKKLYLNNTLKGFLISDDTIEIYKSKDFSKLYKHPLFMGVYDFEKSKLKIKQSTSDVYKRKRKI